MNIVNNFFSIFSDPNLSKKLEVAINSVIFLSIFLVLFVYAFYRFFWNNKESRQLFWASGIILSVVVLCKLAIGIQWKGYIPELWLFYGIPSPKATSLFWSALAVTVFLVFLYLRRKIEGFSTHKFLFSLFIVFFIFSTSVAGIREGLASIQDPLTRVHWEYTGHVPYISSVKDFLHNYITIVSDPELNVAIHSTTHPPGYTVLLYIYHKLFSASFLGMSFLLIMTTGSVLWPIYYLFRQFLSELETKRALQIFIFVPGFVMMSATSMEGFFLLCVWSALSLCFIGWKKSVWLSGLGGLAAAVAFFSNYLFLLLGPFFLFFLWYTLKGQSGLYRQKIILRMFVSFLLFILFFIVMWYWSGYSIINNFFTAKIASKNAVGSNFESLQMYIMYVLMNGTNFLISLGIPLTFLFFSGLPNTYKKSNILFKSGVGIFLFFILIGIFQGNLERLWLFIFPFFVIFANKLFKEEKQYLFNVFLSLMFLQIIVIQVLFYTFF